MAIARKPSRQSRIEHGVSGSWLLSRRNLMLASEREITWESFKPGVKVNWPYRPSLTSKKEEILGNKASSGRSQTWKQQELQDGLCCQDTDSLSHSLVLPISVHMLHTERTLQTCLITTHCSPSPSHWCRNSTQSSTECSPQLWIIFPVTSLTHCSTVICGIVSCPPPVCCAVSSMRQRLSLSFLTVHAWAWWRYWNDLMRRTLSLLRIKAEEKMEVKAGMQREWTTIVESQVIASVCK